MFFSDIYTAAAINLEKKECELRKEIEGCATHLKHTETVEKNVLPSVGDIAQEKQTVRLLVDIGKGRDLRHVEVKKKVAPAQGGELILCSAMKYVSIFM